MYANFIASDFRCSRHGAARPPDSTLFITTQLHLPLKLNFDLYCSQVVRSCHQLQVSTAAVQMAKRGGRRKAPRRGSRRSYVSSAATELLGTITTPSHVKGVKVCIPRTMSRECHVTLNKQLIQNKRQEANCNAINSIRVQVR